MSSLERSIGLWNRSRCDIRSDEIVAQVLDRGTLEDWRELYRLAADDAELRNRIHRIILRVPLPLPHLWLAALKSLGGDVDLSSPTPDYSEGV